MFRFEIELRDGTTMVVRMSGPDAAVFGSETGRLVGIVTGSGRVVEMTTEELIVL